MPKRNLLPWKKEQVNVPVRKIEDDPNITMRRDINQIFDDFFNRSFGMRPFGFEQNWAHFEPRVDVIDDETRIKVTAELPGLDEKEIKLTLTHNTLQISGEKKAESEEKGMNYYSMERSYGMFQRSVSLPCEVDEDSVQPG